MHRRTLRTLALTFGGTVALVVVIAFRRDTALIQALSTWGTVIAAVFTAVAAFAARRAAEESQLTASRAREALARTIKPTMHAAVYADNENPDKAVGTFGPGSDRGALDIHATWYMRDGRTVKRRVDALVPEPTGRNPHLPYQMPLGEWRGSEAGTVEKAVLEYSDMSKVMRWRFTRQFLTPDDWKAEGYEPPEHSPMSFLDTEEPVG